MIQALERGNYYHIYNRGINSGDLFKETTNFEYFLNLFETHIEPIAEVYAWCLMKNHFHFVIRLKEIEEIKCKKIIDPSQSFSNLFNAYTKSFNKKYIRTGALFERPFRRILINNQTYLNNAIVYVHNNPVHHLICEHPIEYPWSSYTSLISNKPTKIKRKETLSCFDGKENFVSKHYERSNYSELITF
jgi:REP element-mobilizing transposase RayT